MTSVLRADRHSGAVEAMVSLADDEPQWLARAQTAARQFARLARHYPILRPRAAWAAALVRAKRDGATVTSDRFGRASRLAERWHVGLDRSLLART